jgi:alcohol dehydrogenase class IV
MIFTISPKSEVVFGEHAADQVGEKTKALGCSKVICIYDQGVKDAGIVDPVIKNLEAAGLKVVQYGKVLPDPPDTMVDECGELARKEKVDGVVGLGGGSTLDTAKAVNLLLGNPGKISDYFGGPNAPEAKPGKPLVLVPTTAGTGSEVTYVSVISDTATHTKGGVKGAPTIATAAIIDPLLTLGMPPKITAATGMDTFAHALEAYTSVGSNIMSDVLSEKAMELVIQYLPKAVKNGSDIEARTQMSFACLIAGMSFNDAMVHFGHAFGHSLGAAHHVAHGIGCAIAQPGVIEIAAKATPKKVRRLGEMLGLKLAESLSPAEVGAQVGEKMASFTREIGIPTLKDLAIKESDLENIAQGLMGDICFMFLPVKLEKADVLDIVKKAYNR